MEGFTMNEFKLKAPYKPTGDIVNIGWHIYLKDITAYAASPRDW